ncbi:MAG: DUF2382 domain-containing protein, partial [Dehalococcoidia bacterium]
MEHLNQNEGERESGDQVRKGDELALHEEAGHLGRVSKDRVLRVKKWAAEEQVSEDVPREIEEAALERAPAGPEDSGQVEELPDGSLSVPLLEEELVVTKRLVVRERVIVRKHTRTEQARVESTLRREHADVEVRTPAGDWTGDT